MGGSAASRHKGLVRLGEHDVFYANSRSVHIDLPPSLSSLLTTTSRQKFDINLKRSRAFVLSGLLSTLECQSFIFSTETANYDKNSDLKNEYPAEYRNNKRLLVISKELANQLWERIQPHLGPEDFLGVTPIGFGTEGMKIRKKKVKKFRKKERTKKKTLKKKKQNKKDKKDNKKIKKNFFF